MKIVFTLVLSFFLNNFLQAQERTIVISNNSSIAFTDQVVGISWTDIIAKWGAIDTANFKVVDVKTKKELVYQLEYQGKENIQQLLVQVTVGSHASVKMNLQKGKHMPFVAKTYCRYVPERKDDFAWENDRIAYRMYGKALETTNENAYGLDVWVKRTDKLVINERYKRNDYHVDHGDGLDCYSVGFTLGAGDIAPYKNDSIYYPKNYHAYKILDNGPIRSSFQLIYDAWDVAGEKVKVTKTISLDAGSQLNHFRVAFSYDHANPLPVVVGQAKRNKPGVEFFNEENGTMVYWQPSQGNNGTTGVASILLEPIKRMMMNERQLLALSDTSNQGFEYYTGACWDKAGIITNANEWKAYVEKFRKELQNPLKIELK
ncbi:MAG: DUF4861 family protein [Bacteroidetes bacterium]|nr:DUF4861 family protein [Bacteroidota bacterium]